MKKFAFAAITASAFAAAAVGLAGTAAASTSTGGGNAGDTVANLQKQGYSVQLNGSVSAPLSQCTVTDVHGVSAGQSSAMSSTTVYVDVSCPDLNN
ncbi:hypothetical protein [Mycobacteroides immunogenum]|uniref:PASTA domain-containing protein n=1 Tax=Mycobacteroides immunogenum TaxID=83262 RepID=A0A7V8LP35_9MYCO|nr:hypothetical protein [Mycobacteroides immunogenum]AMT73937.1 hypothetical protein ABG82_17505 [Mycobacteroides immunogenum]ANO07119.1 hypothetical protein BAB75_17785 [Mycobacteroides immunogenum]KIU39458.1 hypothetical protein TL11_17020 [Mycobacteroides immunogenum]KPG07285.1 hypothetical protein AN909_17190 [Mycobacteroides immunogenum]KPG07366.1 hypothetical protein AN910_20380 [Mycobacteroides immunogenum]